MVAALDGEIFDAELRALDAEAQAALPNGFAYFSVEALRKLFVGRRLTQLRCLLRR